MSKHATLLLIVILTVSNLIVVKAVPALASIPKPSVPEFTLKFAAHPYDVPTTYGIDPYTGKNVTIQEGYHVENKSIEVTIRNQPASNLFYNVRYKGHFGESWTELYSYSMYSSDSLIPQSNSEYTVLSIPAVYPFISGAQIDFQVEALSWHYIEVWISDHPMAPPPINEIGHYEQRFTLDETSDWSNTQTITIGTSTPTATPNTSPSPSTEPTPNSNSEPFPTTLVVASVVSVAVIGIGLLVYFKKRKRGAMRS
jgi:hypothetical protein